MEWIDRLNGALDYIEEHLTDEKLDYEQLGRIACCSSYHFQRMFAYMAGVTLSEYVRRRRMSLAAVDLQGGGAKIIDVALKYGYSSPTAFNRAFQSVHGVAPSAVREEGVAVRAYPPLRFKLTVKGVEEMNYRIETKEAFRVIGVSAPIGKDMEDNFKVVPGMWERASSDGTIPRLASLMNAQPMGLLGLCACNDDEEWRYYIAVSSTAEKGDFEEYTVPAATWAIFPGEGTNISIQELEQRVLAEWLPSSGYEYANAPDIEVYLNPDPNDAKFEVWVPVVKREG